MRTVDVVLFVLASPVLLVRTVYRLVRRVVFLEDAVCGESQVPQLWSDDFTRRVMAL